MIEHSSTHDSKSPFEMSISLSVLDDLGIRLYSNLPAVLSEVVANAWDADATEVDITIDREAGRIVIKDNGHGMSQGDINKKYLTVGYRKRENEPLVTDRGRSPMGRKGIGKLSVFSIARTLEVHTIRDGERSSLRLNSDDIREIIETGSKAYKPVSLSPNLVDFNQGTRLILTDLKRNISATTSGHLRQRLARRFSILGPQNDFIVKVDGEEISAKDRDYYHLLQFMWYLGPDSIEFRDRAGKLVESFEHDNQVVVGDETFTVRGWVGTVLESGSLDDDTNTIVAFAHGKLVHEDILRDLNETGVYASFLIGEVDADFLDRSDDEDIVTSARQSVLQDAERYVALRQFIHRLLKRIQGHWRDLRTKVGADRLLENENIKAWFDRLEGDQKSVAKRMLGKIDGLGLPDRRSQIEMVKANMMAFEKLAMEQQLSFLDTVETLEQFELLQRLFGGVHELEKAHYYQIARGRVDVIKAFEKLVDEDHKEKILQKYLYNHLWLLDPSWEMAAGTSRLEERLTTEFKKVEAETLTEEEAKGRIDIRYMDIAGKHAIIELKRYGVSTSAYDLAKQVSRYKRALRKCLHAHFPNDHRKDAPIECICVVGREPGEGHEEATRVLGATDASYVTYDELINRARESYEDYLIAQRKISEIIQIIERLDEEFMQ